MWEKILRPFLSLYIIGAIGEASEPKCIKAGCDNKQASGSSYCYLHKPYTGHSSYGSSTGSKSSTTKSTSSSSYSGSSSSSSKKTGTSSGSSSSYSTKSHSSSNMLLMIADMILSMMMEIMTGTDIRKIRTMLMV